MSHQHYTGCHLHHFPCALERIRELEREVAQRQVPTFAGYRPPVYLGAPPGCTGSPLLPPTYTVSEVHLPGDGHFAHHGDEPPSATP